MSRVVLYIEDSPDDVFFMQRAFQKVAPEMSLKVITDGQKASDFFASSKLTETAEPLALVLLDLNLPGQSGLQVLTSIRSHSTHEKVPVIIFSASSQQADIDVCYTRGCNAYVVKPNDHDSLKKLVAIINDFWLKTNRYCKLPSGASSVSSDKKIVDEGGSE